jgi:hypothetical protein
MKKARSDSKLANLAEEYQAEIATWCKDGLESARERCKSQLAISISISSLSSWLARYTRQQELRLGNAAVVTTLEWYRLNKPDATADEIRTATFHALALKAAAQDDPELALSVLKEQGKDLDRTLDARRVAMQEARTKAASALQEVGKRLEVTPDVMKEILSAVDRRLTGEA